MRDQGILAMKIPPSIADERWRKAKRLALFAILCAGVACINPRGYEILLFPFKLTSDHLLMDWVAEFLSPNFTSRYLSKICC
jgi:hypothetical protein